MAAILARAEPVHAGSRYLYVDFSMVLVGGLESDQLASATERHRIELEPPSLRQVAAPLDIATAEMLAGQISAAGLVLELERGVPGRKHLQLARDAVKKDMSVFFYWPAEGAVERIDDERLRSYLKLYAVFKAAEWWRKWRPRRSADAAAPFVDEFGEIRSRVRQARAAAAPVPFQPSQGRTQGTGVYLRTDFWSNIVSGGSYGHTCYVAKELAARSENFVCFMGSDFALLHELGIRQVVLKPPSQSSNERELLRATEDIHRQLRPAVAALRPSYIYERLCLGNFAGVLLSQEFGIPYIAEYNGSEISMAKSFGGQGFAEGALFEEIEMLAFSQATAISVVSSVIADGLVERGVDPGKILVNPNGADPDAYAPPSPPDRERVRRRLRFEPHHRVVGFCGTFGGWHGIDVLAKALPAVCRSDGDVRWLLIGDGPLRPQIDAEVAANGIADRVVATGRVPQQEGAELLKACDVYVSPHSSNMIDSPFFGSPTKLFEYMAMGGAIVASDLEQIGQVLSPALRVPDIKADTPVGDRRAVLVTPGDAGELTDAVVLLVKRPALAAALGRNARQALLDHYTWKRHVDRLWAFVGAQAARAAAGVRAAQESSPPVRGNLVLVATNDAYKDEVQNQWNNNPCGSQYAKTAPRHTLDWFLEVERHRYQEYAPWMPETMEFAQHSGRKVLEIGAGLGTDLAQFARHGAIVTDYDLSAGHLELAKENFALRGLSGEFLHGDAEQLPFDDDEFDVVYSNGVIHHTPNTQLALSEIHRVLKPGGKAIVMVYAEDSLHYWGTQVYALGVCGGMLSKHSIGGIMSRSVEMSDNDARPLVKVYTRRRLRRMFRDFENVRIVKRQLTEAEIPGPLRWMSSDLLGRIVGWNLVAKGYKPVSRRA